MLIKSNPPKLPHRFFKWYCRPDRYEELHGDLEELFYERIATKGIVKAKVYYCLEVLTCCQPYAWKVTNQKKNSTLMIGNYYKTSMRSLVKNPLNAFINFFGLAAAIGVCLLAYSFYEWTYRTDQFHENKAVVYLSTFFADRDGSLQQNGMAPAPLARMLKDDFKQIHDVCRVEDRNVVIKNKDNVFHETVRFTDASFLDMLTFPLASGDATSLSDINSIILSADAAEKYFGQKNPIGAELQLIFGKDIDKNFIVTGVAEKFPSSRTIDFEFLINFENLVVVDENYDAHQWNDFIDATLIRVDDPADLSIIMDNMDKYISLQNQTQDDWEISSFSFEQLAGLHLKAGGIRSNISYGSEDNVSAILFLGLISVFLLLLACLNYVNIAVVSAAKRLKEIAVRKSVGATRKAVLIQFLAENIFMMIFALAMGLAMGFGLFIPWFEHMNNFKMEIDILDKNIWIFLPIVLVFTGVVSGIYPAVFISKHKVVAIFKGSVRFGRQNPMTKLFLGFQLVLACIFIACAVMFSRNTVYIANRSWGYDQESALYMKIHDRSDFEQLNAKLTQHTDVLFTAGSTHHLGRHSETIIIESPSQKYEVQRLAVSANYFKTMGLAIANGRSFSTGVHSDKDAIIVNQLFLDNVGNGAGIGSKFTIEGKQYDVIGIVDNFHFTNFSEKAKPTIFNVADDLEYKYLSLKVSAGSQMRLYDLLKKEWKMLHPEIPFQGGYQEDVWGNYFEVISTHGKFWRGIAIIAVLLAGLGLYGLATLNVSGRTKEFSIRKVMGASWTHVAVAVIKQYAIIFGLAMVIGAPISYYLVEFIFDFAYHYHLPMDYYGIVLSVVFLGLVLLATTSNQIRKVAKANPVRGLTEQ